MKATLLALMTCLLAVSAAGQVSSFQRISDLEGGFNGTLADGDGFGSDVAPIGDLDLNGVVDLAVGAPFDDYGGLNYGAVWILFLDHTGSVIKVVKIRQNSIGFSGSRLDENDQFGGRLVQVGDLNGDDIPDLMVSARNDDDGGQDRGAVYTMFMTESGNAQANQKISSSLGGLTGQLDDGDQFGQSIDGLGDLGGDNLGDLVVGAHGDDDGGPDRGAVYILNMHVAGVPKSYQKISSTQGGFFGALSDGDRFGSGVAALGDVNGDGVVDLAVGAAGDGSEGAVWIVFLNADGTVFGQQKISKIEGGGSFDYRSIGTSVSAAGDLDGDGIPDLALGDPGLDAGGEDSGGIWLLFLNPDGTVRTTVLVDPESLGNQFGAGDAFPNSLRLLGDVDGDGSADFGAGQMTDDDGGPDRGAAWVLFGSYVNVSLQKLVAPANGSVDVATNISAVWEAVDGATSYVLQVALSADFDSPVVNAQGLIGTAYPVTNLSANSTYYWRVQPVSLQGSGGWSPTWSFRTGIFALATPSPLEPAFGAAGLSTSPTMTWTASPGASGYDLVISNSPNLDSPVVSLTGVSGVSHTVGPLEPLRAYYWSVRARSSAGDSPWSDPSYFSTGGTSVGTEGETPYQFELSQNYPNPFNPSTTIFYELPEAAHAVMDVSDVSGRVVRRVALGFQSAGPHLATFDAVDLPSGVYSYTLAAGQHRATRMMVVMR